MTYAVLSCDLDTVDCHLAGYGFADVPPCDLIYRAAVPRLLDLLETIGARAVFFVVARDAAAQHELLRDIAVRGHEVASHSLTHPQPFRVLGDAALCNEIAGSRQRLEAALGAPVDGFRAPAWDVDARVLAHVAAAGYRYDASIFPTPALLLNRWATYRRSRRKRSIFSMSLVQHAFAPRAAHRRQLADGTLVEFPIAVTPRLRLPVYHTMSYLMPSAAFTRALARLLRGDAPIYYELHAADLLDLTRDAVDPRMRRHPGMTERLEDKLQRLGSVLRAIADARPIRTYRQALADLPLADPAPALATAAAN